MLTEKETLQITEKLDNAALYLFNENMGDQEYGCFAKQIEFEPSIREAMDILGRVAQQLIHEFNQTHKFNRVTKAWELAND